MQTFCKAPAHSQLAENLIPISPWHVCPTWWTLFSSNLMATHHCKAHDYTSPITFEGKHPANVLTFPLPARIRRQPCPTSISGWHLQVHQVCTQALSSHLVVGDQKGFLGKRIPACWQIHLLVVVTWSGIQSRNEFHWDGLCKCCATFMDFHFLTSTLCRRWIQKGTEKKIKARRIPPSCVVLRFALSCCNCADGINFRPFVVQVPVFEAVCNNRVSAALNVNGCSVGIDATSNVLYSVASPFSSKFGRHDLKAFTRLQAFASWDLRPTESYNALHGDHFQ